MFDKPVYLLDRTHYKLDEVARAIADLFPADPDDTKGINCISEKLLAPSKLQFETTPEPFYLYIGKSLSQKSAMTKEDRERLGSMLQKLPEISHFMTDDEIMIFFDQYYQIPNRPSWEPNITSPADRQEMQKDYEKRVADHCQCIFKEAKNGMFNLIDKKGAILSGDEPNARRVAFMTKVNAIDYLKSFSFQFIIEDAVDPHSVINDHELGIDGRATNVQVDNLTSTKKTATRKPKRDLLIQAIEDYQKISGQDWTAQSMWLAFEKMAKKQEAPFASSAKNEVYWMDDKKRPHTLNLRALKGRLERQKIQTGRSGVHAAHVSGFTNLPT